MFSTGKLEIKGDVTLKYNFKHCTTANIPNCSYGCEKHFRTRIEIQVNITVVMLEVKSEVKW